MPRLAPAETAENLSGEQLSAFTVLTLLPDNNEFTFNTFGLSLFDWINKNIWQLLIVLLQIFSSNVNLNRIWILPWSTMVKKCVYTFGWQTLVYIMTTILIGTACVLQAKSQSIQRGGMYQTVRSHSLKRWRWWLYLQLSTWLYTATHCLTR